MVVVGLLHPGSMGSAVGLCCSQAAAVSEVVWASEGRGAATRARAQADGLSDVGTLAMLAKRAEVILSICPPDKAAALAESVMQLGFTGLYVDCNAVAPSTAKAMSERCTVGGARFVDGGITGGPPRQAGNGTSLLLSGHPKDVAEVVQCFKGTVLSTVVVGSAQIGAASAVKACYAAWVKGSSALLQNIVSLSVAEGVEDDVLALWDDALKTR
eukprot:SAG31_NODE_9788_length_1227_cov_1.094858_1_plen_214_part_00